MQYTFTFSTMLREKLTLVTVTTENERGAVFLKAEVSYLLYAVPSCAHGNIALAIF